MKSFIQWGLVATIALFIIATLARSILTETTKRQSDISIAKLEEVVSQIDERLVTPNIKTKLPATDTEPIVDKTKESVEELRKAWLAWLDNVQAAEDACANDAEVIKVVMQDILGGKDGSVESTEMYGHPVFQACIRAQLVELVDLCGRTRQLPNAAFNEFLGLVELYPILSYGANVLEAAGQVSPLEGHCKDAIDILIARFQMMALDDDASNWWELDQNWFTKGITGAQGDWVAQRITEAFEDAEVSDAQWDRLIEALRHHRDPDRFVRVLSTYTKYVIDTYETWPGNLGVRFGDDPIVFGQNWAYRRITTPIFHHDLDRFGNAMPELLALAPLPFFEAVPALNEFYVTYDVEPRIQDIKLTRQNPSWGCVVGVSRHAFGLHAREQATVDIATIAILLERVRRDSGTYPTTLDDVAARLGDGPLVNPIDGQPYLYEVRGEKYRLGYTQAGVFEVAPDAAVFWNDADRTLLREYLEALSGDNEVRNP